MNDKKRAQLQEARKLLSAAATIVERVCDAEQDALDNMPENLQNSARYDSMEQAIDAMTDVLDSLEAALESMQRAVDQ